MTHPLAHSSGSAAYRGFNPTNKGRGYLPFDTLTERNAIGGGFETTGTAAQTGGNGDDKWERFFGTPPYTTWQRDNYSDLGHENYQLRKHFSPFFLFYLKHTLTLPPQPPRTSVATCTSRNFW